ncbi:glycosyltransferase family 4 protein [Akkermansiaceae bacterium]|nr:glycosyltransferase family 4 protein [Akkermansiaceae bacterium]MDB4600497.1 glycosyltransferase family 4 protein [Akkermansiaceae bacterium]
MTSKPKLFRITTVPLSLRHLLRGQLAFMGENGFDVFSISSDGKEIVEIIKNENCNHLVVPLTRKITPLKDLFAVLRLYILLRQKRPEIVHTHTPKAGIVGMIAAYLAKVPIRLHTVAGLPLVEAVGLKRIVLRFVEELTYKLSTKVYPNSLGMKEIILKNRFTTEDKLRVIGNGSSNGIDTSYFDPEMFSVKENEGLRRYLGIRMKDFVYIFVGRIVTDKGINELVAAFNKLSAREENVKLLLVGPYEEDLDPLRKKSRAIIRRNKKIICVGYQSDVRPYYSISDCLVFPSYREGFPNVVMQAGSMGLPSIVSDINGCNEIIKNKENGIIVEVKDSSSLLREMKNIYQDEGYLKEIKLNARNIIKNKYEQNRIWELLLKEYRQFLNEKE